MTFLAHTPKRRTIRGDKEGRLSKQLFKEIGRLAFYCGLIVATAVLLIPREYLNTLLAERNLRFGSTQERIKTYKSALYMPYTAAGDFERLSILDNTPATIADQANEKAVINQIIENKTYNYPAIKADAYLRAAQISRSYKEKQQFAWKCLETLEQPKAKPQANFRDEILLNWLVPPVDIAARLAGVSLELQDEKLAQRVQDLAEKFDERAKTKEQVKLFSTLMDKVKNAKENPSELSPTPLLP